MLLRIFFLALLLSAASLSGSPSAGGDPAIDGPRKYSVAISVNQLLIIHVGLGSIAEVKQDLQQGADVNYRIPGSGLTPLMVTESPEMMALLLQHGADIKATDTDGATVLHHAVLASRALELIPLLIRRGAEVNHVATGRNGDTPLLTARQWFFEGRDRAMGARVIRLLVQNGAKVNAADHTGYTMLMIAAVNNKPDLLKLMLSLGADPRLQNREGLTALDYARSLKFTEIERLLQAATVP
jgi:ankyrin repeat protein